MIATVDWNEIWRQAQAKKKGGSRRDPAFWDKRAVEFTRHASESDYIGQFLGIMKPEAEWSVLDIGCAAGTLAVPLAPAVKSITALDPSAVMLSLLEERCRKHEIGNVRAVQGRWQDDWDELGIGVHDIAIASRSLVVEDLRDAVVKLQGRARKRVYITTLVDDGPYDRRIIEAAGREWFQGADYIVVYNVLRQMGIYANISLTCTVNDTSYGSLEEALSSMRWMIYEMTPQEEENVRNYLRGCLVEDGGRLELPYPRVERWAVMWWNRD